MHPGEPYFLHLKIGIVIYARAIDMLLSVENCAMIPQLRGHCPHWTLDRFVHLLEQFTQMTPML